MNNFKNNNFYFYDEMQYFCLKNCFFQLMEYMGYQNSLLNIKTGCSLKMLYDNNNDKFSIFKHELLSPMYDMNNVEYGSGLDFEIIFKKNIKYLPVIVLVDVFYLPYRKEFKKYHASHAIFFVDYDNSTKQVDIIDWYKPYFFKGSISINDFKLARNSLNPNDINPFSGFSIKNYWYKINKENVKVDTQKIIIKNLESLKDSYINKDKTIYYGKESLKKLNFYIDISLNKEEHILKDICKYIHDELFIYYRSSILNRRYFLEANKKYPELLDCNLLKFIEQKSKSLEKINFCLLKGSILNPKANLEKVQKELEYICCLYEKFI